MPPTAAPPRSGLRRGAVRHSRRPWRRMIWTAVVAGSLGAVAAVALAVTGHVQHASAAQCAVTAAGVTYTVTPEQAVNAATVSAVAVRQRLPNHAVTIALATALQETKLRNLDYGDRDSLGLFQQRPSQGWGTAAQVSDPTYATAAFYRVLVKLPHWRTDDIATAAQAVQRSADGSAYASWEDEARALAVGLTGEQPTAFTCSGSVPAATTTSSGAVAAAAAAALGSSALDPSTDPTLGRAAATWLVAHWQTYGITKVAYDGYQWTARRGAWLADAAAGPAVDFTLAPPTS